MKQYARKSEKITRVIISVKNKQAESAIFIDHDNIQDVVAWLREILRPIAGLAEGHRINVRAREYFTFPEAIGRKSANGKEVSVAIFGVTTKEVYDVIMKNLNVSIKEE